MKITGLETKTVRIPYRRTETSSLISRGGVTDTIVRITTDEGLTGWGECTRAADTRGIESAVQAMAPLVIGRDPWDKEAIQRDLGTRALWAFQPMTGNFAYAGIDMALWDLCGKAVGQPLYRLLGGALRESVDYFCYLEWSNADEIARQAAEGRARGYGVYYLKCGIDARREEEMLEALRDGIGPEGRIRLDINQGWTMPQAARLLERWDARFGIDFCEAPVAVDPIENMRDLGRRTAVPLCANEGLWREADAWRLIKSRAADYLCFSPYWVGSIARFHTLCWAAHLEGQQVVKHTHGELGLAAAAAQHIMLALPNTADGNQQTAQFMADDILDQPIPIAEGPGWGRIEAPGLGVSVDEDRLARYHEDYLALGEFQTYSTDEGLDGQPAR